MIALPEMLINPATEAGMKTPEDVINFDKNEFPHFHVFCTIQLGSPMPNWTAHRTNAKVIASIPNDKIKAITFDELKELGLEIGYPYP